MWVFSDGRLRCVGLRSDPVTFLGWEWEHWAAQLGSTCSLAGLPKCAEQRNALTVDGADSGAAPPTPPLPPLYQGLWTLESLVSSLFFFSSSSSLHIHSWIKWISHFYIGVNLLAPLASGVQTVVGVDRKAHRPVSTWTWHGRQVPVFEKLWQHLWQPHRSSTPAAPPADSSGAC